MRYRFRPFTLFIKIATPSALGFRPPSHLAPSHGGGARVDMMMRSPILGGGAGARFLSRSEMRSKKGGAFQVCIVEDGWKVRNHDLLIQYANSHSSAPRSSSPAIHTATRHTHTTTPSISSRSTIPSPKKPSRGRWRCAALRVPVRILHDL
jgi:hypothetical protein